MIRGQRANGDYGIFVSPPGVDAYTAADSQLLLNVSNKISQLILQGSVPGSATVPLGLGARPIVLVTSYNNLAGVPGHTWGDGPVRPSPIQAGVPSSNVTINSGGASMGISASVKTVYSVYSKTY